MKSPVALHCTALRYQKNSGFSVFQYPFILLFSLSSICSNRGADLILCKLIIELHEFQTKFWFFNFRCSDDWKKSFEKPKCVKKYLRFIQYAVRTKADFSHSFPSVLTIRCWLFVIFHADWAISVSDIFIFIMCDLTSARLLHILFGWYIESSWINSHYYCERRLRNQKENSQVEYRWNIYAIRTIFFGWFTLLIII